MKKSQVELESRVIRGAHGVASEEDHILTGKVIQVGVGSLVIFIVGGIWAWQLQIASTKDFVGEEGPAPIPALITPDENHQTAYEIGIVNQRLFEQDTHAEEKINAQQRALETGWGETPQAPARIPLSLAMDQVISEQAAARRAPPPPPAPAPQQPAPGK